MCNCRSRLETNAEQWNNLLKTLKDLIDWTVQKDEEIQRQQPVGGDLNSVKKQAEVHQVNGNLYSADVTRCQTTVIVVFDFVFRTFVIRVVCFKTSLSWSHTPNIYFCELACLRKFLTQRLSLKKLAKSFSRTAVTLYLICKRVTHEYLRSINVVRLLSFLSFIVMFHLETSYLGK